MYIYIRIYIYIYFIEAGSTLEIIYTKHFLNLVFMNFPCIVRHATWVTFISTTENTFENIRQICVIELIFEF